MECERSTTPFAPDRALSLVVPGEIKDAAAPCTRTCRVENESWLRMHPGKCLGLMMSRARLRRTAKRET